MKDQKDSIAELNQKTNLFGRFAGLFIDRYRIVYLMMIFLIGVGLYYYFILPRESMPEITVETMRISISMPGGSPEDVEFLITNKIEAALSSVEGVEVMSSASSAGFSTVSLEFFPETDMESAEVEVSQILNGLNNLPDVAGTPVIRAFSATSRPYLVANISGDYDLAKLRRYAEEMMDELLGIPGVDEIDISGGLNDLIKIKVDPVRLSRFGLTMNDIASVLKNNNTDAPGGNIILDNMNFYVRIIGALKGVEDIRSTIIPLSGGDRIMLKDIALITTDYEKLSTISRTSTGLGTENAVMTPSITLSIYRHGNSDVIGPSQAVKDYLEEKIGTRYPGDLEVWITRDDAVTVSDDLNTVLRNAVSGLLVVIMVLFLFLGLREAFIVSLVIPFSMFISFAFLHFFGMTFNSMTLLAMIIALGLLVDNAIVVMENTVRLREMNIFGKKGTKIAVNQIGPAIFAATLTTMAAFIPLSRMEGRIGLIIKVIPTTIIFIIAASLFVSLTITSVLASRFLSKKLKERRQSTYAVRIIRIGVTLIAVFAIAFYAFSTGKGPGVLSYLMGGVFVLLIGIRLFRKAGQSNLFHPVEQRYEQLLTWLFRKKLRRGLIFTAAILLFAGLVSLIPLGVLRIELFPVQESTSIYLSIETPIFSSLDETNRITAKVEEALLKNTEIKNIVTTVGSSGPNSAQMELTLKDEDERTLSSMELQMMLTAQLRSIAGAEISVGDKAGGRAATSNIQLRIVGDNLEEMDRVADDFVDTLGKIPGAQSPFGGLSSGYPELKFVVDILKAETLGISVNQIHSAIKSRLGGVSAGTLIIDNVETPIEISVKEAATQSVDDLKSIFIDTANGRVFLSDICHIEETVGISEIEHVNRSRIINVYAKMNPEANLNEIVKEFDRTFSGKTLTDGIRYEWAGDAADIESSFNTMYISLALAVLLVLTILAIQFNSLTQPFIILVSVPLAMIGVISGLLLTGNNFGLYAFMGVIALVGIGVNDAIVLVDFTNFLRKSGQSMHEAIKRAGKTRFSPVLATSLTTIGAVLPLAFTDVNFAQMSFTLIFGLIASTILTLLIIPIVYSFTETLKENIKNKIPLFVDEEEISDEK